MRQDLTDIIGNLKDVKDVVVFMNKTVPVAYENPVPYIDMAHVSTKVMVVDIQAIIDELEILCEKEGIGLNNLNTGG